MIVSCDYCGEDVKRKPYELKKYKKSFCNSKCRGLSQRNRLEFTCENCGIRFESWPSRGNRRCCSWDCYFGFKKGQAKGYINAGGYRVVYVPIQHPFAGSQQRVYEHWAVMYEYDPEFSVWAKKNRWTIHHRNGVRDDNQLENLEWRQPGRHPQGSEFIHPYEVLSKWYELLAAA